MRIGIIGAGAIGGTIAALLDRGGHEVQLVARGAVLETIRSQGLRLDGAWGAHTARLDAQPALTTGAELVFLTTKAQDAESALTANLSGLGTAPIVVVQNGLQGLETVRRLRPDDPASGALSFGALALYAAQNVEPGRVTITAPGTTIVDRSREVTALLASIMPAEVTDDFRGAQWTKLVINMVNAVPAATGLAVQQTIRDRQLGPVVTALMREAARTGLAAGVRFAPIQGLTHPLVRFVAAAPLWAGHAVPAAMARRMGVVPNLGSTLQSIRRGQPTEIDYLSGAVVTQARMLGRDAPVNAALVEAVHEVEATGRFVEPAELVARAMRRR